MAAVADLEQAVNEDLDVDHDITQLGKMSAIKSVRRNLENEDEAVRKNIEAHEKAILDVPESDPKNKKDAPMDIMVAHGNVTIYAQPKDGKQAAEVPQSAVQPVAQQTVQSAVPQVKTGLSPMLKAAIAAGLLGGPIAGIATAYMMRPGDPNVTNITQGTETGVGLVPPGPPQSKGSP